MILLLILACRLVPSEAEIFDPDHDGVPAESDCDNQNPDVGPGQTEVPYDGVDNDCNADTPDDDLDHDGVPAALDCDDEDAYSAPDLAETPYDGRDNDCDEETPDDDLDHDGVPAALDCDDLDPSRSPENSEVGFNGIDDDCDETTADASLDRAEQRVVGFPAAQGVGEALALPGDLDGDGAPDLLVGGTGGDGVALLLRGPFDEGSFDPATDVRTFTGPHADSQAGHVLAGGADLSGDGRPDLIVGAHKTEHLGGAGTGAVFVLAADAPDGPLDERAVATLWGQGAADRFGRALVLSADATGDGRADLFVGAPYREPNDAGAVYLIAGPVSGEQSVGADALLLQGEDGDTLAQWLRVADVNGDGVDDLIASAPEVGANGAALVVYGGESARGLRPADADLVLGDAGAPGHLSFRALPLPDGGGYLDLALVTTTGLSGDNDGALYLLHLAPGAAQGDTFAVVAGMEEDQGAEYLDAAPDPDGVLTLAVGASRALVSSGRVYLWREPGALEGTHDASEADLIIVGSGSVEAGVAVGLGTGLLQGAFTLVVTAPDDDAGAGGLYLFAP